MAKTTTRDQRIADMLTAHRQARLDKAERSKAELELDATLHAQRRAGLLLRELEVRKARASKPAPTKHLTLAENLWHQMQYLTDSCTIATKTQTRLRLKAFKPLLVKAGFTSTHAKCEISKCLRRIHERLGDM